MATNSLCNGTLLMKEDAIRLVVAEPLSRLGVKCIDGMKLRQRSVVEQTCNGTNYVVDVFLFGYEVDTLEMRLLETKGIVNKTILIESAFDHHGIPKPCIFRDIMQHTERFRGYSVYVRIVCKIVRHELGRLSIGTMRHFNSMPHLDW